MTVSPIAVYSIFCTRKPILPATTSPLWKSPRSTKSSRPCACQRAERYHGRLQAQRRGGLSITFKQQQLALADAFFLGYEVDVADACGRAPQHRQTLQAADVAQATVDLEGGRQLGRAEPAQNVGQGLAQSGRLRRGEKDVRKDGTPPGGLQAIEQVDVLLAGPGKAPQRGDAPVIDGDDGNVGMDRDGRTQAPETQVVDTRLEALDKGVPLLAQRGGQQHGDQGKRH